MSRCKLKGGSLKEAVRAIFKFGEAGKRNEWYVYTCDLCGRGGAEVWHILDSNKVEKQLNKQ